MNVDKNIQKAMQMSKIAHMPVNRNSKQEIEEQKRLAKERGENNPLLKLMAGVSEDGRKEEGKDDTIADGFVRSKANQ